MPAAAGVLARWFQIDKSQHESLQRLSGVNAIEGCGEIVDRVRPIAVWPRKVNLLPHIDDQHFWIRLKGISNDCELAHWLLPAVDVLELYIF